MRLLNRKILFLMVLLTVLAWSQMAHAKVSITFVDGVEVTGERMILGQIARVEGDGTIAERVRRIDLGPAPLPGKKLTLTQEMILGHVMRLGVAKPDILLNGITTKGIVVRGAGQQLNQDTVMNSVYDYIYGQLPAQFTQAEIILKSPFPDIYLPYGEFGLEVGPHSSTKVWGYLTLPVKVLMNGKDVERFNLSLEVRVYQQVFVAVAPIDRSTTITNGLVEPRYMDITQLSGEPVLVGTELTGKVTRRYISKDTIILREFVEDPKVIRRNDQVTIVVVVGSIQVRAAGKALQDGAMGEIIEVENISSGVKIKAVVTGPGTVQAKVD